MNKFLLSYIEPEHYLPSVVEEAASGDIATLENPLRLIRLGIALREPNLAEAHLLVNTLSKAGLVGYQLFQLRCAALALALLERDDDQVRRALDQWLEDWRVYPANWTDSVLKEPALATFLKEIPPERLKPPILSRPPLTAEDRALVNDINAVIVMAVSENFKWLEEIDKKKQPADISKLYHLASVDRVLRECTLRAKAKRWPDLVVAMDECGGYAGSFIAH